MVTHPYRCARSRKARSGLSLIELLVVIAILGILAAIVVPVTQTAIQSGRRAQVVADIGSLAIALEAYYNAYNVWEDAELAAGGDVSGNVINILAGENRRRVTFMEFPQDVFDAGEYRTPPLGPDREQVVYQFAVDANYNGRIANVPGGEIRQRVAVWVAMPQGVEPRYLTSWGYTGGN